MTIRTFEERIATLTLNTNNRANFKFIIDLDSPCSTATSTPTTEDSNVDWESENEHALTPEPPQEFKLFTQPTPTNQVVSPMQAALGMSASQKFDFRSVGSILYYLYNNAVTLADVEGLIPAMNDNVRVMNQLAQNIGWNRSRGYISEAESEQMLAHIFMKGDAQNKLFEQTKAKVQSFHPYSYQQMAQAMAQEHWKKVERDTRRRWKTIPAKYKKPGTVESLPFGCSNLADVYADAYGMAWGEVSKIKPVPKGPRKGKLGFKSNQTRTATSSSEPLGQGNFAVTRLHNGPGLTDKRKPRAFLPKVDARRVITMPQTVGIVKVNKSDRGYLWSKTKSTPDHLFSRKIGEGVVVKLPPRN